MKPILFRQLNRPHHYRSAARHSEVLNPPEKNEVEVEQEDLQDFNLPRAMVKLSDEE